MNGQATTKNEEFTTKSFSKVSEENERLKEKVNSLQNELKQKELLISSLEMQIKHLVLDGNTASQSKHQRQSHKDRSSLPPIPTNSTSPSRRTLTVGNLQDKPDSDRQGVMLSASPTSKDSSFSKFEVPKTLPTDSDLSSDGVELSKDSASASKSEKSKCNQDPVNEGQQKWDVDEAESKDEYAMRKAVLNKSMGAIKALPRELSIFNSDDDEITKYSKDKPPILNVTEKMEMRDAYNARGIYVGAISSASQMPHGKGLMQYHHQGRSYQGDWVQGHWHGHGKIRNANGDVYEGQVVNDLREGHGKIWYVDGRVFEGHFSQDDPVHGTVTFPDGARYTGELHNGTRHGYGVYYFTDGSKYEGYSVMNAFEGKGKMTWSDGGWYEGDWLQGEIDGYGTEIRADGSLRHKGQWSKGVPVRT